MHPYKRTHKPVRHCQNHWVKWLGRAGKATGSLWIDIQNIWFREPPFPASVRILISLFLSWVLIMPFFYILVPPLVSAATFYFIQFQEFPSLAPLPHIPVQQQRIILKAYKDMFKKATFRASMLVTLYDYVQTFRALGGFNGLSLRY
ncbi:hypothetical protein ILUMI_03340 [Ignelater luminosus]|uniref:Uncharacterized protein n=1 Tax=Ignelater luminosus TaxID=2038154 RepID=A0A8K0DEU2_IGNLU|nr:hypothetical protein ILUMI_03340 [Ignelater luminosus]